MTDPCESCHAAHAVHVYTGHQRDAIDGTVFYARDDRVALCEACSMKLVASINNMTGFAEFVDRSQNPADVLVRVTEAARREAMR